MGKRSPAKPRPHATKEVIRAALLDLMSRPLDPTLLPEADTHLSENKRAQCCYPATLRIPGIRWHVLTKWAQAYRFAPPSQTTVQTLADGMADWIINEYLPGWRRQLAELAAELKRQLEQILCLCPYDPARLPPERFASGLVPATSESADACPYLPSLRGKRVRTQILRAWKSYAARKRRSVEGMRRIANRLLNSAMEPYADLIDLSRIARHTTVSSDRASLQALREKAARTLLGAERVPVTALQNCKVDRITQLKGTSFDVPALDFLDAAHAHAWKHDRRSSPIYQATGRSHVAMHAATCWRILASLATRRQATGSPSWMGLNELVVELTNSKGGKRYAQVREFAKGLAKLGLLDMRRQGMRYQIALVCKKVKYLRGIPRRWEGIEAESTS